MLRRAENVGLGHSPSAFTKKGHVRLTVGRQVYIVFRKMHRDRLGQMLDQSDSYPVAFALIGERRYWLFEGKWHWDNDGLNADQVYALLVTRDQRNQARINRAQSIVAMQYTPQPTIRGAIPDDLKQYIWTRDQGRCRACGSNVELQYDHMIPVSMGGATSHDNLQILCGPCNRRKGASVV
jgi:5-methylcytosine-specific restriction endonuclease McrA